MEVVKVTPNLVNSENGVINATEIEDGFELETCYEHGVDSFDQLKVIYKDRTHLVITSERPLQEGDTFYFEDDERQRHVIGTVTKTSSRR